MCTFLANYKALKMFCVLLFVRPLVHWDCKSTQTQTLKQPKV